MAAPANPNPTAETRLVSDFYQGFSPGLGWRGTLRLTDDGKLSFVRRFGKKVAFNAPVTEFHSPAQALAYGTGLHLWHDDKRHRLATGTHSFIGEPDDLAASHAALAGSYSASRVRSEHLNRPRQQDVVREWVETLAPLVGPAPPGVEVKAPLSPGRYLVAMVGWACAVTIAFCLVVAAVILIGQAFS